MGRDWEFLSRNPNILGLVVWKSEHHMGHCGSDMRCLEIRTSHGTLLNDGIGSSCLEIRTSHGTLLNRGTGIGCLEIRTSHGTLLNRGTGMSCLEIRTSPGNFFPSGNGWVKPPNSALCVISSLILSRGSKISSKRAKMNYAE